ncbi:hypothetical protein ACFWBB_12065 [Streptomyces sp. NPDC060000]|uniref:hypothetical protein n=1 Tax=Streptomyces sp. NPDC060000 TaxID=3347031 RepID=UPI00367FEBE7
MSEDIVQARRVIGVEEHAWTPELRKALLKWGGDQTVSKMSSRGEVSRRLLEQPWTYWGPTASCSEPTPLRCPHR